MSYFWRTRPLKLILPYSLKNSMKILHVLENYQSVSAVIRFETDILPGTMEKDIPKEVRNYH